MMKVIFDSTLLLTYDKKTTNNICTECDLKVKFLAYKNIEFFKNFAKNIN